MTTKNKTRKPLGRSRSPRGTAERLIKRRKPHPRSRDNRSTENKINKKCRWNAGVKTALSETQQAELCNSMPHTHFSFSNETIFNPHFILHEASSIAINMAISGLNSNKTKPILISTTNAAGNRKFMQLWCHSTNLTRHFKMVKMATRKLHNTPVTTRRLSEYTLANISGIILHFGYDKANVHDIVYWLMHQTPVRLVMNWLPKKDGVFKTSTQVAKWSTLDGVTSFHAEGNLLEYQFKYPWWIVNSKHGFMRGLHAGSKTFDLIWSVKPVDNYRHTVVVEFGILPHLTRMQYVNRTIPTIFSELCLILKKNKVLGIRYNGEYLVWVDNTGKDHGISLELYEMLCNEGANKIKAKSAKSAILGTVKRNIAHARKNSDYTCMDFTEMISIAIYTRSLQKRVKSIVSAPNTQNLVNEQVTNTNNSWFARVFFALLIHVMPHINDMLRYLPRDYKRWLVGVMLYVGIPGVQTYSLPTINVPVFSYSVLLLKMMILWVTLRTLYKLRNVILCIVVLFWTVLSILCCYVTYKLWMLVFSCCIQEDKYANWKIQKASVDQNMRTINVSGSIPLKNGLLTHNYPVDLNKYPINPKVVVKKRRNARDDKARREALEISGLVFTNRFAMLPTQNEHNWTRSVRSRVILDVVELYQIKPDIRAYEQATKWFHETHYHVKRGPMMQPIPTVYTGPIMIPDDVGTIKIFDVGQGYTQEQYRNQLPGPKKIQFDKDVLYFQSKGVIEVTDFYFEGFMKNEKELKIGNQPPVEVKPRNISGVNRLSKVISGPFHCQLAACLKYIWNPYYDIYYISGATSGMLNRRMDFIWGKFKRPIFFWIDFSKFDMTQRGHVRKTDKVLYSKLGMVSKYQKIVLKSEESMTLFCPRVKIKKLEIQSSGAPNTSHGNSEKTARAVCCAFKSVGKICLQNVVGDDSCGVVEGDKMSDAEIQSMSKAVVKYIKDTFGFVTKIGMSTHPFDGEFTSGRFYPTNSGWKFGKKPGRLLVRLGFSIKKGDVDVLAKFHGVIDSLASVVNHVPFARVYFDLCKKWLVAHKIGVIKPHWRQGKMIPTGFHDADDSTWVAFKRLYSLDQTDEKVFKVNLKSHLKKFGLPSMMVSPIVKKLLQVDEEFASPF